MTKIVVGVDGSAASQIALRWAVTEAKLHEASVEALMAWGFLDQRHVPASERYIDPDYDEAAALEALGQYVSTTLGTFDANDVELRPTCDLPARALLEAGEGASMLVVGARGRGGFASLLLGSVTQKVLHHATCPVAVVRGEQNPDGEGERRVVVGVDGSPNAEAALRWAIREGRRRGASVEVVHAWQMPFVAPYPSVASDLDVSTLEQQALETVAEALGRAGLTGEDRFSKVLCLSGPASLLLETANGADLIVVGSRGLSAGKAAVLGSVSHQVTLHATCPVVVIPERAT